MKKQTFERNMLLLVNQNMGLSNRKMSLSRSLADMGKEMPEEEEEEEIEMTASSNTEEKVFWRSKGKNRGSVIQRSIRR
nr:hypothetical protein [Niallia taxi]